MGISGERTVLLVLRVGLAFAFLYPPVSAYFNPLAWIGYFPSFLRNIVGSDTLLLYGFGIIEVVIALWLLWGKYIFYPAVAAVVILFGVVLFNLPQIDILFRDLVILATAVALALSNAPAKSSAFKPGYSERD
jgi:cobalamin biosynthesis protein CobD/CbiB